MMATRRKKLDAAATRDVILDVVGEHLGLYGFSRMTVEDVAREAGIGKGTIYLHFKSKEDLVLAQIDRVVEVLLAKLRSIAAGPEPAADRLRQLLVARVQLRWQSVQDYRRSLAELLAAIRPALLQRHAAHCAAEVEVLASFLATAKARRELAMSDPATTAE